jgi:hypothetical protein
LRPLALGRRARRRSRVVLMAVAQSNSGSGGSDRGAASSGLLSSSEQNLVGSRQPCELRPAVTARTTRRGPPRAASRQWQFRREPGTARRPGASTLGSCEDCRPTRKARGCRSAGRARGRFQDARRRQFAPRPANRERRSLDDIERPELNRPRRPASSPPPIKQLKSPARNPLGLALVALLRSLVLVIRRVNEQNLRGRDPHVPSHLHPP